MLSSVHDVSTEASSAMQPRDQGIPSNVQNGCSSQLAGHIEAAEMKAKQQERNPVPPTVSSIGIYTRRQDHVGTASEAVDLRQDRLRWSTAEEDGSFVVHAQKSSHTECTVPSQMKHQAGELIGEYILYRF